MNNLQKIGAGLVTSVAALGTTSAQAGGFVIRDELVQRTWVERVPVYQQFDTYARTPCGPQYVGSSHAQVGWAPVVRQEIRKEAHLRYDPCKKGLLDQVFEGIFCCPQERRQLMYIAPVAPCQPCNQ